MIFSVVKRVILALTFDKSKPDYKIFFVSRFAFFITEI